MFKVGVVLFGLFVAINAACLDNKYSGIPDHTGCLDKSSLLSSTSPSSVSEGNKTLIVAQHNAVRRAVSATDMLKMSWDDELAALAQNWADQCRPSEHDENLQRYNVGRYSVGQNAAEGASSWTAAINLWAGEQTDFVYNVETPNVVVGHYTQLVWAKSNKVGCGVSNCTIDGEFKLIHVCNYGPAGNIGFKYAPYTQGTPCGDCPSKCDNSAETPIGLCDCTAQECLNGGTFNLDTCECTCLFTAYTGSTTPVGTQTGSNCALDCTANDEGYCGSYFLQTECPTYGNYPQQCPHMCGLCPPDPPAN